MLSVLSFSIKAQNFTYNPAQHIDEAIQAENYSTHGISMITNDLSAVHYRWTLIENTLPADWSYSLCDLGGCYVGIPNSGTMQEITELQAIDGVTGFLKLNITASTFYGEGDAVFYVYDIGDMANGDAVSMHSTWANPSSGISENANNAIEAYPNPVQTQLNFNNISKIERIEILGINGQIISNLKPNGPSLKVDFSTFPGGVYFAKLTDDSGQVITKRIYKN